MERPLTDDVIVRPDFLPRTLEALRTTHEFVQRINRAVQYAYEEMM